MTQQWRQWKRLLLWLDTLFSSSVFDDLHDDRGADRLRAESRTIIITIIIITIIITIIIITIIITIIIITIIIITIPQVSLPLDLCRAQEPRLEVHDLDRGGGLEG